MASCPATVGQDAPVWPPPVPDPRSPRRYSVVRAGCHQPNQPIATPCPVLRLQFPLLFLLLAARAQEKETDGAIRSGVCIGLPPGSIFTLEGVSLGAHGVSSFEEEAQFRSKLLRGCDIASGEKCYPESESRAMLTQKNMFCKKQGAHDTKLCYSDSLNSC